MNERQQEVLSKVPEVTLSPSRIGRQSWGIESRNGAQCAALFFAPPSRLVFPRRDDIIADMASNSPSSAGQVATLLEQAASCHRQGRLQEALGSYQQAIAIAPGNFQALHGMGILCAQMGRFEEALKYFTEAGKLQPNNYAVHFNRAKVLSILKRFDEALAGYDKTLSLKPDSAEAYNNRGNVLKDLRRYDEALVSYARAIALKPDYVNAYHNQGATQILLHRYDDALASYDKLLLLKPDYVETYNNRAFVLKALGRFEDVLANYDKALSLNPGSAAAHHNRATALETLQRFDEALAGYDSAIALKPDFAESQGNRGNVLRALQRYDEALSAYAEAIALNPSIAEIYSNQANLFIDLGRYREALACFDRAIALKPDFAEANYNKGLLELLLGNYREGWQLHEWRWKTAKQKDFARNFQQPLWLNDAPLGGRTLLLHAEQGLGDTLQFVRYVPMVEALGARVILEAPAALAPLLRTLKGDFTLIEQGDALPGFDLHCPLMSLPLAFGTTVDSIPANIPYLAADPQKRAMWRERLGPKDRPRIGLVWSGAASHSNDRHRSMGLVTLTPLLLLDYEFHSLQKELRTEDRAAAAEFTQVVRDHGAALHDFADTAALVAELDLIITVDTSVAHLAGAMGKPVWILLSYVADFRWLTERSDSPWYPTARLFRQDGIGSWSNVLEDVISELGNMGFSEPAQ